MVIGENGLCDGSGDGVGLVGDACKYCWGDSNKYKNFHCGVVILLLNIQGGMTELVLTKEEKRMLNRALRREVV